MKYFKKIKCKVATNGGVAEYTYKNVSLDRAVEILSDPNVISFSATEKTPAEYLRAYWRDKKGGE